MSSPWCTLMVSMITTRFLAVVSLLTLSCHGQGLEFIKSHYTKYEFQIPMRDGKRLFTSVYVPKDTSEKYPIMLDRTPYSVSPYGVENYKTSLGPSEKFAREQFIFVYQDVRGRYMSEGDFVNMTPHRAVKRGPADIDESTDTYDTIEWLVAPHPQQQRQRRHVGHLVPGLLHLGGHHRRASRAQSRFAAGAHRRLVHRRRFPSQRRALPAAHVPFLFELRPAAPRAHPAARRRRPTLRAHPAGWLQLLPRARAARQHQREVSSRTTSPSGTR